MRILISAEGTYPYNLSGVSSWCHLLVRGLAEHHFIVMSLVPPGRVRPRFPLPDNAVLQTIPIWSPRGGLLDPTRPAVVQVFHRSFAHLLGFAEENLEMFALGLAGLARLGSRYNLWPPFLWRGTQAAVRKVLARMLLRAPSIAEVMLAANWLRGSLVPILFEPPTADLAHTVISGLGAIPAWLAARIQGIPLVLTEHGLYLRERYLAFPAEEESPGIKLLRARFYRSLARLMYTQADRVVTVCEFNRQWQLRLGAPAARTRIIPPGTDPGEFPPAPPGPRPVPTVVWVGRIDPLKDLETLVSAFALVREVLPQAVLRLFGPVPPGAEEYFRLIRNQVANLRLEESVVFEGPVSPVYRAFHAADVVVLSSISEGFPQTLVEAMMCGVAVVATRAGGVAEAVGPAGLLVPPKDAPGLSAALVRLLRDKSQRDSLGTLGRERALELFTLDRMVDVHRSLYTGLAEAAGRERVASAVPV